MFIAKAVEGDAVSCKPLTEAEAEALQQKYWPKPHCEDCPPPNYPTDKTRCAECPRRFKVTP
jgi:hypothetical protein